MLMGLQIFLIRPQSPFFFLIFPECADTEQILERQVLRERLGSIFYQLTEELNPGRLGEKHERYLCAMPSPCCLFVDYFFHLKKMSRRLKIPHSIHWIQRVKFISGVFRKNALTPSLQSNKWPFVALMSNLVGCIFEAKDGTGIFPGFFTGDSGLFKSSLKKIESPKMWQLCGRPNFFGTAKKI